MKVLFSPSCSHLIIHSLADNPVIMRYFPDGEIDISITCDIQSDEKICVVASIDSSQSFFKLLMMLNILRAKSARIFLILAYVSYLRNGKSDQSSFGQTILNLLTSFDLAKITIIHPHRMNIKLPNVELVVWKDFFIDCARDFDLLVAPDRGARALVNEIGKLTNKPTLFLEKQRNVSGSPEIVTSVSLNGECVLILDDMISTGGTLIKASEILKKAGASYIGAAATHGIFCNDALHALKASALSKIFVTNTLNVQPDEQLTVSSILPFINQLIKSAQ